MANVVKTMRVEQTTTVTFSEEQVKEILRREAGAPATARVDLLCGYDGFFEEAKVVWSVAEEKDL